MLESLENLMIKYCMQITYNAYNNTFSVAYKETENGSYVEPDHTFNTLASLKMYFDSIEKQLDEKDNGPIALAKRNINHYIITQGGILNIKEADEIYNDLQRELIQAMFEEYGEVWLASPAEIKDGDENTAVSRYTKYIPSIPVRNGDYTYCIPKNSSEFVAALEDAYRGGLDVKKLNKAFAILDANDGVYLDWR